MSVWESGKTSAQNEDGSVSIRTIYVDGITGSNGEIEIDLSGFDINEIVSRSVDVMDDATGLADLVFARVVSITETIAKVVAYQQNTTTVTVGATISPFVAVTTGVNVRLKVLCR